MSWEFAAGVILFGFMFTFAYLSTNTDKKHGALQFFFIMMSTFSMVFANAFLIEMANAAAEISLASFLTSIYSVMIYVPVIVAFYFIIIFVWNIFAKKKAGAD